MAADVSLYLTLHVGDTVRETGHLSAAEMGVHVRLMMAAWPRGGLLPADRDRLARVAGVTRAELDGCWPALCDLWPEQDGQIKHAGTMAAHAEALQRKVAAVEKARKAAAGHWNKRVMLGASPKHCSSSAQASPKHDSAASENSGPVPESPESRHEILEENAQGHAPSISSSTAPSDASGHALRSPISDLRSPDPEKEIAPEGVGKTRVRKPSNPPLTSPGFAAFWAAYPRKTGKGHAIKAWPGDEYLPAILAALEWQVPTWRDPDFIKHPATWLHARCWEDEKPGPRAPALPPNRWAYVEEQERKRRALLEASHAHG